MKQELIKELTDDELTARIVEEKNNLLKMRMSHSVSPIENPLKIRTARKFVARLLTEMKARSMKAKPVSSEK
jgi:large subunit ribosomal protein L29